MKRKIKLIIAGILACICHLPTLAQSGKLFNTDNQLSSNLATQVYQDTNGFIWITTRNGLNIYDGYNFSVVKKGGNDNRELNTNYINCIAQDYDGYVLLGTNRGLLLHNGQYFQDIHLPDGKGNPISTYVTHIGRLQNGDVLIGTSGYGIFLIKKSKHATVLLSRLPKAKSVLCSPSWKTSVVDFGLSAKDTSCSSLTRTASSTHTSQVPKDCWRKTSDRTARVRSILPPRDRVSIR